MVEMAAPAGGVFASAKAFGLCRIQNLLNSAPYARGSFGLYCPDRLQDPKHVVGADGVDGLPTQGCSICLQRGFPLCLMFFVPEPRSKRFPDVVGHLAERWNAAVALAFINRVQALGNLPACTRGFLASIGEGDAGGATKPHFLGLIPDFGMINR